MSRGAVGLIVLLAVLAPPPAFAHKLKVFATAVGSRIEGRVYFVGGGGAAGAALRIEAPPGETVADVVADDGGRFAFTAVVRADYRIFADTGDGHSAEFVIPAGDLPSELPEGHTRAAAAAASGSPPVTASSTPAASSNPGAAETTPPVPTAADAPWLRQLVAEAVAQQVRPLREQLNTFEDQVRVRDIVGGLGYILGLAGLALWLKAPGRRGRQ